MTTEADLQRDLNTAMKARDMPKVYVLRGVLTAVKNLKVEKQVPELPETEIALLVRKEISKGKEAEEFAAKGGRDDLVAQSRAERALLEVYLPVQLDAAKLEAVIRDLAQELGGPALGPIMAKLKERYAGQYDGKLASEIARKLT